MKTLLLDVGNSRLKWAFAVDQTLQPIQALAHGGDPAAASAAIEIMDVDAIWIANVTGAAHADALTAQLSARHSQLPRFAVATAECLGLRVAYPDARRLGVDRWLALLAARTLTRGAASVASCGTALTFDAVSANGRHLGGVIAPGLLTAQQAVLGATRFAANAPGNDFEPGLGMDTEACVRQGALHACAGLVDRLAKAQSPSPLFLTGGDAEVLQPHLATASVIRPDLVLQGLLVYATAGTHAGRAQND